MKCINCGAQLRLGSVYCAACGKEAQIVSDSNLLEEELLRELLQEDEGQSDPKKEKKGTGKKKPKKKKRNHMPLILTLTCLCLLLAAGTVLIVALNEKKKNSFDYQLQMAQECMEKKEYTKALNYYKRALELEEGNITALFQMADLYCRMEEEESAISLLCEIVALDPKNRNAYERLVELYEKKKDYQAIVMLKESVTEDGLLDLFEAFVVQAPEFDLEPGTYGDGISVGLKAEEGNEIFYTTDGASPIEQGKPYQEPIVLEEQGTLEIQAVCRNEYGLYSEVAEGDYAVEYEKPQMPVATPDSGNFQSPALIELTGSEGSRMFYTWDGSDPTVDSQEYTQPIPVPEGNHILSVILVDKHGMVSDILKCNYRYYPY